MKAPRSPILTVGGKASSAERIVSAFPPPHCYDRYVEVCGGAAHVLFCKDPYNQEEVYNDLSNNLIAFWEQIQCNAEAMQQRLDDLPYARKLYYDYYRSLFDGATLSDQERAIRFFYCLRSTGSGWLRKSPVGWNCQASKLHAFRSAVDLFQAAKVRMRNVLIDNRDCIATIKRYDGPKTLFFCDPPYIDCEHYYEASRDGFDHVGLADVLNSAKGYVALSYYPHDKIDKLYPESRWRRMTWQQGKHSSIQQEEDGTHRIASGTELLLMNYPASTGGLFDERIES
jgi:DNA adenine methylase